MVAWAALFGSLSAYVGLLASYHWDYAAGASIVLVAVSIFFVVLAGQGLVQAARRTPAVGT
jgi:ABC-type Mn2+/Zn2+ transport system permease subunit